MTYPFIASQLLTDKDWQQALSDGFVTKEAPADVAAYLRQLIEAGMAEEDAEVARIVDNAEAPNFDNTIVQLNTTGAHLDRATTVLFNLLNVDRSDALEQTANDLLPRLTDHSNNKMLNEHLWRKVKQVYDQAPADLTGEQQMLLKKTYQAFERSGATLSEADKVTFRRITKQLSTATLKFSQNLIKDTHAYCLHIEQEADLDGLSEAQKEAAAQEAAERQLAGWAVTLSAPSYLPFMKYAKNRSLREQLYKAYNTRCLHGGELDNRELVREIVNLRQELAQLLGYQHFAAYALQRRMAASADQVYGLLNDLVAHYADSARAEVARVQQRAQQDAGADFVMQPWDFAFYSRVLKDELYDIDQERLQSYFELSHVVEGVFALAHRLYGLTFEADDTIPVYHADVQAYRVNDADGSFLAVLYMDFYPRASKQSGAWMTNYREEHSDVAPTVTVTPHNSYRPVVSVTTNFTKPTASKPALLTFAEVETLLHEFGHALHGIFAMTHYEALSGTSVYWDFVELPSQFMENYAVEPEFLITFARHYLTGEPLPNDLIEAIKQSRNFNVAYACMRQVSFGLLDMAYYTLTEPLTADVVAFEKQALERTNLLPPYAEGCMSTQFEHIMAGGYAAGYYSYKWAEVLDADAFAYFKQQGIFSSEVAARFREELLAKGGTMDPMTLYVNFCGHRPTIDALLKRDGLH